MKILTIEQVKSRRGDIKDFVVSARGLLRELEKRGFDLVPRVGTGLIAIDLELRDLLLMASPGDTQSGRVGLYVCPLCGDFGCGVVSAKVSCLEGDYVWSDFVHETNLSDECLSLDKIGPFRFDGNLYRKVISGEA
jgi:hypothetical protein